jgi:uncharacterized membrane protein required for colicin V production
MIFDILFVVLVGLGFYQGYTKGIIYSILSFLAYFFGLIIAIKFTYLGVKFLDDFIHFEPQTMRILGFVFVFILVLLMARLIAWILEQILKAISLNFANQISGALLHAAIGFYVMCIFTWYIDKMNVLPASQKEHSHTYPYVHEFAPTVMSYTEKAIPFLTDGYRQFEDLVKKASPDS